MAMGRFIRPYVLISIACATQLLLSSSSFSTSPSADSSLAATLMESGYRFSKVSQYDSALICYQRAGAILTQTEHRALFLHCLNKIADSYVRKTRCDSALAILGNALRIEQDELGGRGLEVAETYALMGYAYSYQDRAELAIEHINKALAIRREELGENSPLVGKSYYMLGVALRKKGDLDGALDCLQKALRVQKREPVEDSIAAASTLIAMGSTYESKSQYSSAIGYFLEAISLLVTSGERSTFAQATCHFYLATCQKECGDVLGAIGNYNTALNLSRQLFGDEHQTISACYAKLAELYELSGDNQKAIELSEKALDLMVKLNGERNSGVAAICNILAAAYNNVNKLDKALEYSFRAISIQRSALGDGHPDIGLSCERLANIYEKRHEYPKALEYYNEALQRRLRLGGSPNRIDVGRIYMRIGMLHREAGEYHQALRFLNQALHVLDNASENNRSLVAATYKALGDVHLQRNDFPHASSSYDESIKLLRSGFPELSAGLKPFSYPALYTKALLEAVTAKAQLLEVQYNASSRDVRTLEAALGEYERAMDLMGQLRKTYKSEESKLFLQAEHFSVYESGVRVSLQLFNATHRLHYKASAFSFAEKSKAAVLRDAIQEAESRHFAGIPDSMLEKERRLRTDISLCETQLSKAQRESGVGDTTREPYLQRRLFAHEQEYQRLLELFETSFPRYYDLKYKDPPATVLTAQHCLDQQTCLLEYLVGEQSIYIFAISQDSFEAIAVPRPADFERLTRSFCQSLRTIDQTEYLQNGTELYKLLIEPVRKHLAKVNRLVIVPDGPLHHVPFEALIPRRPQARKGAEDPVDFTKLPYLVRLYQISYAYSSGFYSAHARQTEPGGPKTDSFLGFAPVFRDSLRGGCVLASTQSFDALEVSELRSFTLDGRVFKELPYSEEEVRSITSAFAQKGGRSIGFFHSRATKENFRMDAGKYGHIHIATHGYMNENYPGLSALVFASAADAPASEDPLFYAGDTYNLALDADLLVLSACESGIGRIVKGEGMMGMTRGFFYSGARNIVYSLWKVFDKQTTELMQEFYSHVLDGDSYSSSLRKAKLKLVSNPATAFPGKWAGFVLVGR